ncbi:hypothetical protein KOR42_11810 [Thalassoglobus neptunius]|uniref:Uncharacterized protein n=1 Tax=Thalassoglobus neptunius TaxID=1938619 RepID=A0A5C5X4B1_9PLAN|nr:hypothetical protein [Thalassoglobus neptunius]TWT57814.1 hypothetical protein KOR42_11810 [Thalassoglobus neptunius]
MSEHQREHQKLSSHLLIALGLACVVAVGCGGGDGADDAAASNSTPADTSSSRESVSEESPANAPGESEESPQSNEMASAGGPPGGGEHGDSGGSYNPGYSSDDDDDDDDNGYNPGYDGGSYPGSQPRKPPRPENVAEWTPEQVTEAIAEGDVKVIPVFETFSKTQPAGAEAVKQFELWIAALTAEPETNSGGNSGYPGGYDGDDDYDGGYGYQNRGRQQASPKSQIAASLIDLLAQNGTKEAYAVIQNVFSGTTELGLEEGESEKIATNALLRNIPHPNNPTRQLLWTALTQADSAAASPFADRAVALHIGLAISAIDALVGVPQDPVESTQSSPYNSYNDYDDDDDSGYDSGYNPDGGQPMMAQTPRPQVKAEPIEVESIPLSQKDAESIVTYLWTPEFVQFAAQNMEKNPESTDALLLAAQIPAVQTRDALRSFFADHNLKSPAVLLAQEAFEKHLHDPAIHLLTKAQTREERPEANPRAGQANNRQSAFRPRKKDEPDPEREARIEAGYAWLDASEQSLIGLMDRMKLAATTENAVPFQPAEIPLELHRNAEVTASHRFEIPVAGSDSSELAPLEKTIVNYVRIESSELNNTTVQHYRNAVRGEEVRTILNGNGMWLDAGVKKDRKSDDLQSVDVLLSRNKARGKIADLIQKSAQNGPANPQSPGGYDDSSNYDGGYGGGQQGSSGGEFVVEILVVQIPDNATEDAQVSSTE